jgi:hypothetical protein
MPLIACEAALLIFFLAQPLRFGAAETFARNRQTSLAKGYSALVRNSNDREAIKAVFPDVDSVTSWYGYLKSHHLGPDPREFGATDAAANGPIRLAVHAATDPPKLNDYQIAPADACWGFLDEAMAVAGAPNTFTIMGWAWDRTGKKLPPKVALALPDGSIQQTANFVTPRPDVQKALPEITVLNTGWRADVVVASGVRVRAYAILGDQKTACPLPNEFIAP